MIFSCTVLSISLKPHARAVWTFLQQIKQWVFCVAVTLTNVSNKTVALSGSYSVAVLNHSLGCLTLLSSDSDMFYGSICVTEENTNKF